VDEKKAIKKEISLIYCFKNTCYVLPVKIHLSVPLIPPIIFCFCFLNYKRKAYLAEAWPRKLLRRLKFYGLFFVIFIHNGALAQRKFSILPC
jgi:hypothetical protein